MRTITGLVCGVITMVAVLSARAELILVQDTFTNDGQGGIQYLTSTNGAIPAYNTTLQGQSGSLVPLVYSSNSTGANAWRQQVEEDTDRLRMYGKNTATTAGYATNFEYNQMRIDVDMATGDATWANIVIGNTVIAGQSTGPDLFALRVRSGGLVEIKPQGTGSSSLNFTNAANTGFDMTSFRIVFNNTAWDGTGNLTLDAWVNKTPGDDLGWTQFDLNGAGEGMSLYRETGFTDNYITVATQHPNVASNTSGYIDNIVIAAIPEPAAMSLLALAGAAMLARRRLVKN